MLQAADLSVSQEPRVIALFSDCENPQKNFQVSFCECFLTQVPFFCVEQVLHSRYLKKQQVEVGHHRLENNHDRFLGSWKPDNGHLQWAQQDLPCHCPQMVVLEYVRTQAPVFLYMVPKLEIDYAKIIAVVEKGHRTLN
ncbi:hypothetical protein AcV5_007904 [Taiwanofungus camphoratus]|nr:hypothetical protein AcV5_007904 [Antrodia cinnamomea]